MPGPQFSVRVLATVAALCVGPACPGGPARSGDYAGWIYFDAGVDMPLRLHLRQEGDGDLSGAMDLPVYDKGAIRADVVEDTGDRLRLGFPDAVGFKVELRLEQTEERLAGEATWTGEERTLEADVFLHRAAAPLPWVSMAELPDASGVYPLAPGRTIIISRRPWGELFYSDPLTGRSGFLFAQSPRKAFAGSHIYVPAGVTATVDLEVDDTGDVTGIIWRDEGGRAMTASRSEFVTETLAFASEDAALLGEVIRLPGDEPRPGLVVIGGSDWSTASGLRRFARRFAAFGLTVLTFDKRGHGGSGGQEDAAFDAVAGDVAAAAETLARRPDVIDGRVGVFGYSRAGWHIPLAASRSDAIAFAVMFVPPAVSPAVQETTRRLAELRRSGVSDPADLAVARRYLEAMWDFARTAENGQRYLDLRAEVRRLGWLDVLAGPATLDEDEWRWSRLNMHYDPVPALRNVRCPVLAVFGGADTSVTPEQNAPIMRRAFAEAGNADARIEIIEGADHGLRPVPAGGESLRYHEGRGDPAGLWPLVYEWLSQHAELELQ